MVSISDTRTAMCFNHASMVHLRSCKRTPSRNRSTHPFTDVGSSRVPVYKERRIKRVVSVTYRSSTSHTRPYRNGSGESVNGFNTCRGGRGGGGGGGGGSGGSGGSVGSSEGSIVRVV